MVVGAGEGGRGGHGAPPLSISRGWGGANGNTDPLALETHSMPLALAPPSLTPTPPMLRFLSATLDVGLPHRLATASSLWRANHLHLCCSVPTTLHRQPPCFPKTFPSFPHFLSITPSPPALSLWHPPSEVLYRRAVFSTLFFFQKIFMEYFIIRMSNNNNNNNNRNNKGD